MKVCLPGLCRNDIPNHYSTFPLAPQPGKLYNPSHPEVVRDRLSARKEGHWLKAFTEKDLRSRLENMPKKAKSE
jgi:hypothetical protein